MLWVAWFRPWRRERWLAVSLTLTAALMFGLMLGQAGSLAPYTLMRHLPMMASFRVPSRFTMMFVAFAAPLAAFVSARDLDHLSRDTRTIAALVLILATLSLAYRTRMYLVPAFPIPPLESSFQWLSRPGAPALDTETDAFNGISPMLRGLAANRDVVRCNEPLVLPGNIDPQKPVVFADPPAMISELVYSPNRIRFGIVAAEPTRVFLNQRYLRGWRSSLGPLAIDPASGLAYVPVPGGTATRVELSFTPPGLVTGFVLLAAGVLLSIVLRRQTLAAGPESSGPPAVEQRSA
jgi:hypothetical protein